MFLPFSFCRQNSYKSWLLLYFLGGVPQKYLRSCLSHISPQKVSPRKVHEVEDDSHLLGCAYFHPPIRAMGMDSEIERQANRTETEGEAARRTSAVTIPFQLSRLSLSQGAPGSS